MTKEQLNDIDLSKLQKYLSPSVNSDFNSGAGSEHYRLLTQMAKGLNLVYDIGTYRGASAVALSSAKQVETWDVENLLECNLPSNVNQNIGDCFDSGILKADLILLDTYHLGDYEVKFVTMLIDNGYKGLLLLDDIHLSKEMEKFWQWIPLKKQDLTHLGHYTGTGLVYFD